MTRVCTFYGAPPMPPRQSFYFVRCTTQYGQLNVPLMADRSSREIQTISQAVTHFADRRGLEIQPGWSAEPISDREFQYLSG